jgi:hypothetical protein
VRCARGHQVKEGGKRGDKVVEGTVYKLRETVERRGMTRRYNIIL